MPRRAVPEPRTRSVPRIQARPTRRMTSRWLSAGSKNINLTATTASKVLANIGLVSTASQTTGAFGKRVQKAATSVGDTLMSDTANPWGSEVAQCRTAGEPRESGARRRGVRAAAPVTKRSCVDTPEGLRPRRRRDGGRRGFCGKTRERAFIKVVETLFGDVPRWTPETGKHRRSSDEELKAPPQK